MDTVRLICPNTDLPKETRINMIFDNFNQWLNVDEFQELVKLFGGCIDSKVEVFSKLEYLKNDFIDIWDYRKHQKEAKTKEGEAARWLLQNDKITLDNKDLIYSCSKKLGLIGIDESIIKNPDYILPLGGARMSNLRRCELAKNIASKANKPVAIIALSGMRPISDSEKEATNSYAPNAKTEYDVICKGMKTAFSNITSENETQSINPNPNLSYSIKEFYTENVNGNYLSAIAAPSTDPSRRANSADCFQFFFEKFHIKKGSKIINCTSQIYCTYQQVKSMQYAIEHDVQFDTIGFPFYLNKVKPNPSDISSLSKPVNYLQEIKATIDAMYEFMIMYRL
ncbi:hypothetical protein [Faecalicoccus pleomorphus]|uniref:hypothetical protein n=1 Tax=Faecalicoccus pleomorphus TaxID=1323 RepID=UPI0039F6064E